MLGRAERAAESEAADWPSESLVQLLPVVAFWAVKPERAADVALGRHNSSSSPWNWLPPLLVTMLTTLPVLPPNSAEKALVSTSISCTDVERQVLNMVWRPQAIVAGAAVHHEQWSGAGPRRWW